ncbi:MAG: FCD domain-containing protein, partial [Deltaproteobacteria bacterium]|nr:FCD domain-containing protein [Deltaproteobacteria bacterium]
VMERLDREKLDSLYSALETHNRALEQGYSKRILLADMEFHLILASISGDDICERLLRYLFEMLYLKYRTEILFTHPRGEFAAQHKVLLELLEAGDEDGARQLLSDHILSVRDRVLESMRRNLEDEQLVL